jgi:acyl-CoA synthetase (AMP-forming)/AMP-acid ligase II
MAIKRTSAPDYGRRLLLEVLEDKSVQEPDVPWIKVPRTSDLSSGWEDITYGQAAKAVDFTAHKIVELCGHAQPDKFPVIAYIGPNDVRYHIMMLAAGKAGYQVIEFLFRSNTKTTPTNRITTGVLHIPAKFSRSTA